MLRTRKSAKLPNGSLPPTYSAETGRLFFDGLAQHNPVNGVNEQYLAKIGISEGTIAALLGGLRWSGIVERDSYRLLDANLPTKLRNPQTRKQAFLEIVNTTYPDLMSKGNLNRYNYEQLKRYFEDNNVKETSSARAARCFMYLAQEAGIQLAEELPATLPRPDLTLRNKPSNSPAPFQSPKQSLATDKKGNNANHPKVRYLEALLKNIEAGALPDKDLQATIDRLMDEVGHLL